MTGLSRCHKLQPSLTREVPIPSRKQVLLSLQPVQLLLLARHVWGTQAGANIGCAGSCYSSCSDLDMVRRQATLEMLVQGDCSRPPISILCQITKLPSPTVTNVITYSVAASNTNTGLLYQ
jgi:hypothetical protein